MRSTIVAGALLALALGAGAAQAQVFPGGGTPFPGGRGGMGRGRGGPRWDGGRVPEVPDLRNPIRLIVDNADDLQLTPEQKRTEDSLAVALDRQNDTLVAVVRRAFGEDSARAGGADRGDQGERPPRDPAQAIVLRDRLNALKPTIKAIRKNDDDAWKAALVPLTKDQRKKAEKIRKDDEKAREQERGNWRGAGGRRGRWGGGPGDE